MVAAASKRFVVVIDESKVVKQLGVGVIPVEILPYLWRSTAARLATLATRLTMRGGEEAPFITDNGNVILDLTIDGGIVDAPALATPSRPRSESSNMACSSG